MATAHLAVEVAGAGRHPAAWRRADASAHTLFTGAHQVELARLAAAAGVDLVFYPDAFAPPGQECRPVCPRVARSRRRCDRQ